ncbi:MAG: redoxin family protein [Bacteroidota bacterium]
MKKVIVSMLAVLMITTAFVIKTENPSLKIGDKAPLTNIKMLTPTDVSVSLDDVKKENGLLVVFSCNTCPFVLAWEDRYNELSDLAASNKIGMVLVNSNEAKRAGDDSKDEMARHMRKMQYKMPYVIDNNHKLADAFGARTTPHVYLFNKKGELAYVGAIDDNQDKKAVSKTYLKSAINELGKGKTTVSTPETKAVGCSIKRTASK